MFIAKHRKLNYAIATGNVRLSDRYQIAATSDNTRRAYQSDIRHFEMSGELLPATPDAILRYLHTFAASLNPRTLARHITSLRQWHIYQNFPDPTQDHRVSKTLTGISRIHGKPKDKAPPLLLEQLIKIIAYLSKIDTLSAIRDSALLQIGFLGALRRSELAVIKLEDISWQTDGIEILIPKSKTDQVAAGQYCAIPYGNKQLCAISALKLWLETANINNGYVFRRLHLGDIVSAKHIIPDTISKILKKNAVAAGLLNGANFSSHSLRRGLATTASRNGASISAIMRQGRWRQVSTVIEYIEAAQRFDENVASHILNNF